MAKKRRRKRRRKNPAALFLLLLVLLGVLALGVLMISRTLEGKTAIPQEPSEILYVITEPPATETSAAPPPTQPVTALPTTEAPTEPPTLPPGTVTGITLSFYHATMFLGDEPITPVSWLEPEDAVNSAIAWSSSDESVATVDIDGNISAVGEGSCTVSAVPCGNPELYTMVSVNVLPAEAYQTPPMSAPADWADVDPDDPTRPDIQVIGGCTYVQGVLIVNKTYPIPASREPGGLTAEASQAFAALCQAARDEAGLYLYSHSGYRPYSNQRVVYSNYVRRDGQEKADTFSARPGYSEHETGMVIDVNFPGEKFDDTPEAVWLEENCTRFGFVIRYPREKEPYTGYKYESWHIRYVGEAWAKAITESGLSIEEYFRIRSVYPTESRSSEDIG